MAGRLASADGEYWQFCRGAIHPSHTAAEAAIKELQQSGFDMKKLRI